MFLDAPATSGVGKALGDHLRILEGVIIVVKADMHAVVFEHYNVGQTIPSGVCDETSRRELLGSKY